MSTPEVRTRRRPSQPLHTSPAIGPGSPVKPTATAASGHDPALAWAAGLSLSLAYRPVSELRAAERNARTHTEKQVRQIAASIREFGFVNPILVDAAGQVIAGHGRLAAAKLLEQESVPTIRLDHLTNTQKRAYVIADNRLAELAGWDENLLAIELEELSNLEIEFDLEITGFDTVTVDSLIDGMNAVTAPDPADEIPEAAANQQIVARPGDLWLLGKHRVLCADSRDKAAFDRLLNGNLAQLVFTDPPYNVAIDGHVSGLGRVRHREFAMASGEMNKSEFIAFLKTVLGHMAAASANGAIHYVCMDWRHAYELMAAGHEVYSELKNLCVWNKDNGGMGTFYRSKHELVFVYKNGSTPHINNFGLGDTGRYRTNVWDYAGVNSFKAKRMDELVMHPTVKPVAMVADAIKDCSKRNGIVLDGFGGSGTTLVAAEKTGRRAHLLEIDPAYVDVTVRRWQSLVGEQAIHVESGLTFDQLALARVAEDATAPDDNVSSDKTEADHV